jgi:hypothetical protein
MTDKDRSAARQVRREELTEPLTEELLASRVAEGWRPVAIEWIRDNVDEEPLEPTLLEVPYGYRIAEDGIHLAPDVREQAALMLILDQIVIDRPLAEVATELERQGFRTRSGRAFNQVDVFELLPRIVESSPGMFRSHRWLKLRELRPRAF